MAAFRRINWPFGWKTRPLCEAPWGIAPGSTFTLAVLSS